MNFFDKVKKFNDIYKLPNLDTPALQKDVERLKNFHNILAEEVDEGLEIVSKSHISDDIDYLTDLADWLGDVVVFCASEARRIGIPLEEVLDIIMESNFSKLGADGKPLYDERGKVMKGPNYWKPEAKIKELLLSKLSQKETK